MGLVTNLDISMSMDASAFNTSNKAVADGLRKSFDLTPKLASGVAALQQRLQKSAETFGKSATESEIFRLSMSGVPPEALKTARALAATITKLEDLKKAEEKAKAAQEALMNAGKGTFENTRTAAEKYKASLADLKKQLAAGAISQDTFNRAVRDLKPDGFLSLGKARGVLNDLGKSFAIVGAAATAAVASLLYFGKQALTTMDDTGDLAAQLGISTSALTGLSYAAELTGSHAEDVGGSLKKLNVNLSNAAAGAGPARDALTQLGLSAKDLSKMSADSAFKAIAGGFQSISSPADKAAIAMALFGKSGQSLINTLNAGPDAIEKFIAEGKKLGAVYGDDTANMAGAANDAITRLTTVFTGLGNTITVAVAPFVVSLGQYFTELAASGTGASGLLTTSLNAIGIAGKDTGEVLGNVFMGLGTVIGVVADSLVVVKLTFLAMKVATTVGILAIIKTWEVLLKGLDKAAGLVGLKTNFSTVFEVISANLQDLTKNQVKEFKDALGAEPPSTGITTAFSAIKKGAEDAKASVTAMSSGERKASEEMLSMISDVSNLKEKLTEEIATVGMSSEQMEVYKLKLRGASAAQLESLSALAARKKALTDNFAIEDATSKHATEMVRALSKDIGTAGLAANLKHIQEQYKNAQEAAAEGVITDEQFKEETLKFRVEVEGVEKAKGILSKIETPLDKYKQSVLDIKQAFVSGNLTRGEFVKSLAKAKEESGQGSKIKLSGALEAGSQEARSSILAANSNGPKSDQVSKNTATMITLLTAIRDQGKGKGKPGAPPEEVFL